MLLLYEGAVLAVSAMEKNRARKAAADSST